MISINSFVKVFISFLCILPGTSLILAGQNCMVEITSPTDGGRVNGYPIDVSGTASNIPSNHHVWVLISPVGYNGWWPQGNGPAFVYNNEWVVKTYLGNGKEKGEFRIVSIVVDQSTHKSLKQWVEKGELGNPLTEFPTPTDECPMSLIIVEKH